MPTDAGTIYSEVRIELGKLKGDIRRMRTEFDKFGKTNQQQSTKVQKSWTDKFKKIGLAGVAAFAGIGIALKKAISQFADFEQAMANVQSVARATPEEFRRLEDVARKAGETTKFTATESAEALYSLASAGLSARQSAEALDGVLQLAGATQSDLADTAATVTAALSQYDLEAEESTRVSNVFAAAIANSQANMGKLSSAMRQVGPVAGTLGISLEETTGAMQALFDAGFKGEQAGTGLRNVLASLANEVSPTVRKLEKLGISFEDINPSANSLTDVIGVLAEAGLETGQAIDAFGQEAGPQLLTLLQAGREGLKEYTDAVTDTNSAAEAYAIQMDTLEGSTAQMKSAIEAGAISFVKVFAPAIRTVVDALTVVIRWMGKLPKFLKVFFGVLVAGVPAVVAATIAISALAGAIGTALGPITLIVGGVAALVAGISGIVGAVRKARIEDITERFGDLSEELDISIERISDLEKKLSDLGDAGDEEIEVLITKLKEFQDETGISDEKLDELIKTSKRFGATDENIDQVIEKVHDLTDEFDLSKKEIRRLETSLRFMERDGFTDINAQVEEFAKVTGYSREEVLRIGIASGNLTKETKEQLQTMLDQFYRQQELNRQYVEAKDITQLRAEFEKDRVESLEKEAELNNQAEIEAAKEAERIKDLAERSKKVAEARIAAEEKLRKELKTTQTLKEKGIISEEEAIEQEINAREQLASVLAALGYTGQLIEETWTNAAGERVTAIQQGNVTLDEQAEKLRILIAELQALQEAQEETGDSGKKAFADISAQTDSYEMQLLRLVGTEEEVIIAEHKRAIAAVLASGASTEAINEQITATNLLYLTLLENTDKAEEKTKGFFESYKEDVMDGEATWEDWVNTITNSFTNFVSSMNELSQARADKEIEIIDRELRGKGGILESIEERKQAALEAAGVVEETQIESLQRQRDEAIDDGDAVTASRLQDEIDRLKITQQYEDEKTAAIKEAEEEQAQIRYEADLAAWRSKVLLAVADAARAIIMTLASVPWPVNLVAALGIGAATIPQIAAIKQAKPEEPSFASGGVINPIPHFQTGGIMVPSGPDGRSITVAENGAPELMLNAGGEGAALLDEFANRIVRAMGTGNQGGGVMSLQLMIDGRKVAENTVDYINNGQVRVKL